MKQRSSKAITLPPDYLLKKDNDDLQEDDIIPPHTMDLPLPLQDRLFEHQRLGVNWLHRVHQTSSGGILGDDMGLGKTFQVSCLLCGLLRDREISRILIVCPVSVIQSWSREISDHIKPYVENFVLELVTSDLVKKKREKILREIFTGSRRSVAITSYNLLANMSEEFGSDEWDYVILDEGHTIKNPSTKMSKAAHSLRSKHRLLLTGTPIQNNLMELYTLVHWATNGRANLGTKKEFNSKYVWPIEDGQNPRSTEDELIKSQEAAHQLRRKLKKIILQRKKSEFEDILKLPEKIEVVVWIPLSPKQREMYQSYLRGPEMALVLTNTVYPIMAINYLKTLSRHPFLLEAAEAVKMQKSQGSEGIDLEVLTESFNSMDIKATFSEACEKISYGVLSRPTLTQLERMESQVKAVPKETIRPIQREPTPSSRLEPLDIDCPFDDANVFGITGRTPTTEELLQDSTKLQVCLQLIRRLRREDHRILVFSQSKFMLDIIQKILAESGIGSCRIDGSVCGKDRQRIIDQVNDLENGGADVCLLTTRACGFGITLTGADRVIVFDPSWNPAEDRQAVDRAYRIGQTREVVVYRFIMAGSLEQEMYKKEVFKDGLRVASEREIHRDARYFADDPKKLFELDQPLVMHDLKRKESQINPNHPLLRYPEEIKNHNINGILGITKHDLLYAASSQDVGEPKDSQQTRDETFCAVSESTKSFDNSEEDLVDTDEELNHKTKHTSSRLKKSQEKFKIVDLTQGDDFELPVRKPLGEISENVAIQLVSRRKTIVMKERPPRSLPIETIDPLLLESFEKVTISSPEEVMPPQVDLCPEDRTLYDDLIRRAEVKKSEKLLKEATVLYIRALEISDEDIELHRKLYNIQRTILSAKKINE